MEVLTHGRLWVNRPTVNIGNQTKILLHLPPRATTLCCAPYKAAGVFWLVLDGEEWTRREPPSPLGGPGLRSLGRVHLWGPPGHQPGATRQTIQWPSRELAIACRGHLHRTSFEYAAWIPLWLGVSLIDMSGYISKMGVPLRSVRILTPGKVCLNT